VGLYHDDVALAMRWYDSDVHYFLQSPGPALTIQVAMLCTVSCITRTTHAAPCSLRLAVTVPLAVKRCRFKLPDVWSFL
jgi:hypothetical protein